MSEPHRTRLPHYLAVLYGLMIVYASLEPFSGWMAPLPDTPFFLFAPWPPRFTRFDIVINVIAYAPFGFLLALIGGEQERARRGSQPRSASPRSLSFAMESTQMFLPMRDASALDFVSNTPARRSALSRHWRSIARRDCAGTSREWRNRVFLGDRSGDLGLALLVHLAAVAGQSGHPAIRGDLRPVAASSRPIVAGTLLQAAQSAFNVIGVGLFLALLLRQRRDFGSAVLALIALALVLKVMAAALLLLKSAAWESWLKPGVSLGVAAGALVLLLAIWLPRPVRTTLCAIALLSSLVAPLLAPDMWQARAPLALFDWSYGQLLNFNGLTHAVLVIWPLLASAYLLWLAGQPGWGRARRGMIASAAMSLLQAPRLFLLQPARPARGLLQQSRLGGHAGLREAAHQGHCASTARARCASTRPAVSTAATKGPVLVVYPDAVWYTYVDRHDIDEIIDSHLVDGRVVERLKI